MNEFYSVGGVIKKRWGAETQRRDRAFELFLVVFVLVELLSRLVLVDKNMVIFFVSQLVEIGGEDRDYRCYALGDV